MSGTFQLIGQQLGQEGGGAFWGCALIPPPLCLESDVADFDGRSSLLYRFNQKLMSTLKDVISLKFKSMQGDGVLFHGEGQRGDHITLELQRGRLALHLNLGRSGFAPPRPCRAAGSPCCSRSPSQCISWTLLCHRRVTYFPYPNWRREIHAFKCLSHK